MFCKIIFDRIIIIKGFEDDKNKIVSTVKQIKDKRKNKKTKINIRSSNNKPSYYIHF